METVRDTLACGLCRTPGMCKPFPCQGCMDDADSGIIGLSKAGYAIVPREATQPMLDAAIGSTRSPTSRKLLGEAYAEEWRAMLTAAEKER